MLLTLDMARYNHLDNLIGVTPNKRVENDKYFVVLKDITIELTDGERIKIRKGFRFDGSSVPKWLRGIFPTYGPFLIAALIHDWMYVKDYRRNYMGLRDAQKFADNEMLLWSMVLNNRNWLAKLDNKLRYRAVRMFGKKVYKR